MDSLEAWEHKYLADEGWVVSEPPVSIVAHAGNAEAVQLLLDAGANVPRRLLESRRVPEPVLASLRRAARATEEKWSCWDGWFFEGCRALWEHYCLQVPIKMN